MRSLVLSGRKALTLPLLAGSALVASPAFAQTGGGATIDTSAIGDAFAAGMQQGIELLMTFAPTVVLFAVVWMLIRRASSLAKAG